MVGEDDELCAIAGAEFDHRAAHVGFGCRRADNQPLGDLIVGKATGHQRHHLTLALGQHAQVGRELGSARQRCKLSDQPPGDAGGEQPLPARDRLNTADQLGRLGILDQKTAGASP